MNNESEIKISGKNKLRQAVINYFYGFTSWTSWLWRIGRADRCSAPINSIQPLLFNLVGHSLILNQSSLLLSAIFIPIYFYLQYPQLKFDLISCLSEFFPCELSDEL